MVPKQILANGVRPIFNNSKSTDIDGLTKSNNVPFWLVIFLVASHNKTSLFSKDLNTFLTLFLPCKFFADSVKSFFYDSIS